MTHTTRHIQVVETDLRDPRLSNKDATTEKALLRIPELDGLRGVAILMVLSFHFINNQLTGAQFGFKSSLAKITSFGWIGVDLFFVLSGFLIGSILIRNKRSKNYFSTFYIRRLVRIMPNYYLLLVVFLIISAIPTFQSNYFLTGNRVIPTWSYFAMIHNFFMAGQHNLGNTSISIAWSIGIEEQFYIVFPFIVYFLKDRWLPYALGAAILTAITMRGTYSNWVPAYTLLSCRMDAISFGALIAWANFHYDLRLITKKFFPWLVMIAIADALVCAFLYYRYNDLGPVRNTLFSILFSIFTVFTLTYNSGWLGQLLRNKLLMWIGTISYSLYLFHYMILGIFNHFLGNHTGVAITDGKSVLFTCIALATSLFVARMVFVFLETPMVKWGKRFKF
jgi:peptidoglycan/LPS O-acetylase OafA/YrhL